PGFRAVLGADGELELLAVREGIERGGGEFALLVERVESDLEVWQALAVEEPLFDRLRLDAPERLDDGVLRVLALSHHLHDVERRQVVEVRFAAAGRTRGTHVVVDVETGAENRRIAHAPGDLEGKPARRRDARDFAARAEPVAVDRAVDLDGIDEPRQNELRARAVSRFGALLRVEVMRRVDAPFPLEPQAPRPLGVEVRLDGETHVA